MYNINKYVTHYFIIKQEDTDEPQRQTAVTTAELFKSQVIFLFFFTAVYNVTQQTRSL